MEGRPKNRNVHFAATAAVTFSATHQAHAHGFDAVKQAQGQHVAPKAYKPSGSNPVPGGGARQRARQLARDEAAKLKAADAARQA